MNGIVLSVLLFVICSYFSLISGQTYLRANGQSGNTYALINSVLGGTAVEVPDCKHSSYGPHITQAFDAEVNRNIFVFHAHVDLDDDTCTNFDRQRTEIKTYNPSPEYLKGRNGETVTLSWNFRLWSHFQPSSAFTHIHQLKDVDGDNSTPIITLTPRYKSDGNILEIIHVNSAGTTNKVKIMPLKDFVGKWIHVKEKMTYGSNGRYSIVFTNLLTGAQIGSYTNNAMDLWRNGASYVRPKWGIYRSLTDKARLKDEQVLFDTFCFAKGSTDCP